MLALEFPVGEVGEQDEALARLAMSEAVARTSAAEWRQLQTLLRERERALITACVTGEFDISTASSRAGDAALAGLPTVS